VSAGASTAYGGESSNPLERFPERKPTPPEWETQNLGVMRLLLDDVQDLMSHLARLDAGPVLQAGNSLASDAESLKDATREELGNVTIVACEGAMLVKLGRQKAELWWRRSEPGAVAAAADCASLLRKKRLPGPIAFLWLFVRVLRVFAGEPRPLAATNSDPRTRALAKVRVAVRNPPGRSRPSAVWPT